jgi:hypothetical protein
VRSRQLLLGSIGGVAAGLALVAGLRLYQGAELFASPRMTLVRAAIGVCFVVLGLWTLARAAPGRR